MSRRTKPMSCSKRDIIDLQKLADDSSDPRVAERARMVLECAKGHQIKDVAAILSERPNTIIKWKKRYEALGIGGLYNAPRGSTKDVYGEPFAKRLRELLNSDPPAGEEYWTGPLLAEALGTPNDTIRRYLRRENIQLLEYRRQVKESSAPDKQDVLLGEHEDNPLDNHEYDAEIEIHSYEGPSSTCEDGADSQRGAVISPGLSNVITYEKCMYVRISSSEDIQDARGQPLDVHVHVSLMDKEACIQESSANFQGVLPNLRQFNVEINDTS